MPSNGRKKRIREIMAETGMNYMRALHEYERRAKARAEAKAAEAGDEGQA
jgi:hypothetical protein